MPDGRVGLVAVMDLGNLDIPFGPQSARGALDELGKQGNAERGVRCLKHRNLFRRSRDPRLVDLVEAGGADEDGDFGGQCPVEARLECGWSREID